MPTKTQAVKSLIRSGAYDGPGTMSAKQHPGPQNTRNLMEEVQSYPKIIFLDFDGVLNDHSKHPNGYGGITLSLVPHLNSILDAVPEAKIVVSSSWRYVSPDPKVHEFILLIHGVNAYGRVLDVTVSDEEITGGNMPDWNDREAWMREGLIWRVKQIRKWVEENDVESYVVLDDLPLVVENLVQTQGNVGLTQNDAEKAIALLTGIQP